MVSKRGDNAFHGTAFYSHFNSALNAREFFQPRKPVLIEHKAHADVSGPIFPNRTFFYVSYFLQRLPAGSFNRGTVPTQKMRQGDFTQVARGEGPADQSAVSREHRALVAVQSAQPESAAALYSGPEPG